MLNKVISGILATMAPSEQQLLEAARAGDQGALETLLVRQQERIY